MTRRVAPARGAEPGSPREGRRTAVDLSRFDNAWYRPGRGIVARSLWFLVNALVLQNPVIPFSRVRIAVLRLFGARVGRGVVIKPSVNVKYPWNVTIGDHSWIGEHAWLDSLAEIRIGRSVCVSQGAYLCTGNHDWSDPAFGLIVKPIVLEDGAWVGARATVLPGVTISDHSVLAAGAVASADTEPYRIYAGNPAAVVKDRGIGAPSSRT